MDWSLIIELVMAVITGGVVTSLVTMRETKRGMKLDNIAKEEETKNLEIDRWSRLCDDLQTQLADSQNRLDGLNDKLDKKDERIMELEDRCVNYRNKIDTLNTALAKAIMMRCTMLTTSLPSLLVILWQWAVSLRRCSSGSVMLLSM